MAYIYQVRFDILPGQMSELRRGTALRRVLSYLRTLLPSEPGYVTSRAMDSLDLAGRTELVFQSVWRSWEDIDAHRRSALEESKILVEFQGQVVLEHLTVRMYEEVD